ncbi:SMP-30/gluconolactonase/LRE family protein [Ruminococcus sp. HUN007]|uniref:SMP-30/gluconolactonase/LRE family protein n=1 Tax=Ruminococcus sp. HUN007 TaxID=1514668 RepID=UPI000678D190|nr:SMP-30/gluconolactonase/LRE family protein [Ruminococcus sp. HUN007]
MKGSEDVHRIKKIAAALSAAGLCFSYAYPASAQQTSATYSYDRWGDAIPSQAGYEAVRSVYGKDLGISGFSEISDLFIAQDGKFYIADSGNDRIIIADGDLEGASAVLTEFDYEGEKLVLSSPGGVYVSAEGMIYIADTDNSRIIRCDQTGKTDLVITRPDSDQYTAVTFMPKKVLCDKAGFIYAVDSNVNTGAVMFSPDGSFRGFYGANRVGQTGKVIKDHFFKLFAGEEMRKYMTNTVPSAVSGFDIDSKGFIYTCSSSLSQDTDRIKKVNAAGYNLFEGIYTEFGDRPTADYSDYPQNSFIDIDTDPYGNMNCLDYTNGRVFQYDEDCELLFIFGGKGSQTGTFRQVSAIESTEKCVYVSDSQKNTITVFEKTDFGGKVHEAERLYNAGYYDEALGPWFEVLGRDGSYRRAFIGIADAYINQGRYEEAMKYAKLADSGWRYDRAFEGAREKWISEHFPLLAFLITAAVVLCAVLRFRKKTDSRQKGGKAL